MISRRTINRLIILGFFVLTGYCLATSIAVKSGIGVILAAISLIAGIVFLYLLAQAQDNKGSEESA